MYLAVFYSLITTVILLVILFFVMMAVALIYIKLKFEPVKGVCVSKARLDNKIVLVTGGNQGIGLETARDLASRGARVIIACRDEKKAAQAITDITRTTGNKNIEYKHLDLASFNSVRKFAKDFNQTYDRLDILINNAGCAEMNRKATEDGIDLVMQVNYLGPFLLTNLLLDKIKASPAGRIVIVSSHVYIIAGVTPDQLNGLNIRNPLFRYAKSKLCDILWMKALAKRLPGHVTVNAVHPGLVKTGLFDSIFCIIRDYLMFWINVLNFKTPKEGAQTTLYVAVSEELDGVSGKYFMECKETNCTNTADNDELGEEIWNKSVMLTR